MNATLDESESSLFIVLGSRQQFSWLEVGVGGSTLEEVGQTCVPWTGVWHLLTKPILSGKKTTLYNEAKYNSWYNKIWFNPPFL